MGSDFWMWVALIIGSIIAAGSLYFDSKVEEYERLMTEHEKRKR